MGITTIGIDIAKNVFQVHGVNNEGSTVLRKKLRRNAVLPFFKQLESCLIGMEACATAHHWARGLSALGHSVKLMPPTYVKPYVKRSKNDAADAEAICEAVNRPTMRFVPVKTEAQQAVIMLHKTRDLLTRQKTMLINALRSHCAEYGIIVPKGVQNVRKLIEKLSSDEEATLPELASTTVQLLIEQVDTLEDKRQKLEKELAFWHGNNEISQRVATVPGVGIITATAIAATITDARHFKSGRQFAAFLGLVPRQFSTGGKERLGRISKQGNQYLRRLLIVGATSMLRHFRHKPGKEADWMRQLLERRSPRVVSVALANKMARIVWAVMAQGSVYRTEGAIAS